MERTKRINILNFDPERSLPGLYEIELVFPNNTVIFVGFKYYGNEAQKAEIRKTGLLAYLMKTTNLQERMLSLLVNPTDKTYQIPVTYSSWGLVTIRANNIKEIDYESLALPQNPEYIDDSYRIDWEGIPNYNELTPEEEKLINKLTDQQ